MTKDRASSKVPRSPDVPASHSRDERLDALETRLKAVQARQQAERGQDASEPAGQSPLGQAMRLSGEFIAGVIVGGGFGWVFDRMVGSSPWGLIIFLMLGFAAGVFNVMRSAGMWKPSRQAEPPAS